MRPMILCTVHALPGSNGTASVADMATPTARERLRALVKENPDVTAAEASRQLGISRQRVGQIAEEEGLELSKYVRGSTPLEELAGTAERARRVLDNLRAHIAEAKAVEKKLTAQLREARKRS